jgi:DNA-binding MarR family transcriptional regulator
MKSNIDKKISEVIFNIYRKMKKNFQMIKGSDLTMIQLHGLIFIKENKNCQLTDVAQAFSITLPTANSLVEKLVNLKLITKTHDKDDQRLIRLKVTKKGETLIKKMTQEKERCFSNLIDKLDNKEKERLLVILKKIIS